MKREARTERFQLMMEPSLVKRVDDWRYANRVTSRALAIRRLLDAGLDGTEKQKGPAVLQHPEP